MNVDIEVLEKYNRPGPRYTSYPPAPHFSDTFGPDDYEGEIVESNAGDTQRDVSLYVHLPFCQERCYFCGCNVIITRNRDRIARYLRYLDEEIDRVSGLMNPARKVVQMHWGGGTPTYLTPAEIEHLMQHMRARFNFANDAELSIEIDPRSMEPNHLETVRRCGFNRVSFGVQDFDENVQVAVNRVQPESLTRDLVRDSRGLGFSSINVDLIYGLPHQTLESYRRTLDKIIDIAPDRLAVFNYAHVPWLKKHQRVIAETAVPPPQERLRILKQVIERLTGAGYTYIGMDHFAKPGDELVLAMKNGTLHRNFQGYTTHAEAEVYAMGITAISQLTNVYAQNVKTESEYMDALDAGRLPTALGYRLTREDHVRRHVIMQLLCNGVVDKRAVETEYGLDFDAHFSGALARLGELIEDDLVRIEQDRIVVESAGRLVGRNVAMAFDGYLADGGMKEGTYSRTV